MNDDAAYSVAAGDEKCCTELFVKGISTDISLRVTVLHDCTERALEIDLCADRRIPSSVSLTSLVRRVTSEDRQRHRACEDHGE